MARNIKAIFTSKYPDVAITDSIWSVIADTTECARNVADHFDDASQIDCAMRSGSLGLQYTYGMKDDTRTTAGIRTIITPGSNGVPYTAADGAVKGCWSLVDFFGKIERRSHLGTYALVNNFKYCMPKLDGDTCVSSCYMIIQQMLFSYPLLCAFFNNSATGLEKQVCNTMINSNNWELLEILETVLEPLAIFLRASSQTKQIFTSSYFLIMKRDFYSHLQHQNSRQLTVSRFANCTKPTKLLLVPQEIAVIFALTLHHASSG